MNKKMRNILKNIYNKIYGLIYSIRLPVITKNEEILILELRNEAKNIQFTDTQNLLGSELEWANNMNNILNNISKKNPREFLSWDVIKFTMFVVSEKYIKIELSSVLKSEFYENIWKNAILESSIGKPMRYWRFPKSSGNLIHHIYHLVKFKESTNVDFDKIDLVLEFGGGYGSMCRVLHKCNFKKKYIIFDLPVFSALQKYYLKSLGIKVLEPKDYFDSESGVICISDFHDLNKIILHHSCCQSKLFIGTWSFSETPVDFRSKFMSIIATFNYHLISYQKYFKEVDNVVYFNSFKTSISTCDWNNCEINHLPNNYYLFGRHK